MNIYIEKENDIIHETNVDFTLRPCSDEIHLVQYDKSLPIIKVNLFKDGFKYIISSIDNVNVRLGKLDKTFVYKSVLGINSLGTAVYFEIDEQMTSDPGKISLVLEIIDSNGVASSSPIALLIDRNPIQNGDIESNVDFSLLNDLQEQIVDLRKTKLDINGIAKDSEKLDGKTPEYYLDYNNLTNVPKNIEFMTDDEIHEITGVN